MNKTYNISFQLKETDKVNTNEHPHLSFMMGVRSEVQGWLEDLGFEIENLNISKDRLDNGQKLVTDICEEDK